MITNGLSVSLLKCTSFDNYALPSLESVRAVVEAGLQDGTLLRKVRSFNYIKKIKLAEKVSVRRMMSRYWSNSSIFALDLVGAVIRQGSFIEKMHALDWLHSPTLNSTMTRLLTKYSRYFEILKRHPRHVAVPTLDVDLAWYEPSSISPYDLKPMLILRQAYTPALPTGVLPLLDSSDQHLHRPRRQN